MLWVGVAMGVVLGANLEVRNEILSICSLGDRGVVVNASDDD